MTAAKRALNWMFSSQTLPVSRRQIIVWWEIRRVPFNILVGAYGAVCLAIFFWAITASGRLRPGEDAVEPLALFLAPLGVNLCYTLGWLLEVTARTLRPSLSPNFGPNLLRLGTAFSLFLISLPAAVWGGYRLLQWANMMQ